MRTRFIRRAAALAGLAAALSLTLTPVPVDAVTAGSTEGHWDAPTGTSTTCTITKSDWDCTGGATTSQPNECYADAFANAFVVATGVQVLDCTASLDILSFDGPATCGTPIDPDVVCTATGMGTGRFTYSPPTGIGGSSISFNVSLTGGCSQEGGSIAFEGFTVNTSTTRTVKAEGTMHFPSCLGGTGLWVGEYSDS